MPAVKFTNDTLSCMLLDRFIEGMEGESKAVCYQMDKEMRESSKNLREQALNQITKKETFKSFNRNYIYFVDMET